MSEPHTLVHRLAHWAEVRPNRPAIHGKKNGEWVRLTWSQYWSNVRDVGKGLIALGHRSGESIAMAGGNHMEWVQYQFGAQAARGVPAPIYGTTTLEQAAYIVKHCGARIVVCDGLEQLNKFVEAERRGLFEPVKHYLMFFDVEVDDPELRQRVLSLAEVIDLGREQPDAELDRRLDELTDDEPCLLIYTSGTTGVPKGVEIDHGGQLLVGQAVLELGPQFVDGRAEYRSISYLPLSHQAEQLLTNVMSLMVGGQIYFCPEITAIKDYLADVRPTVFLGVPRVWEKFQAALQARLAETQGFKKHLADWAMRTEQTQHQKQVERGVAAELQMPFSRRIARKLVVDKIKNALGLDQLEIAVTGSAPIGVETQQFFAGLGIQIYEAYGMTETCGVATVTDRLQPKFGTVGRALTGVEIRIGDEGEIQLKGRNCETRYRGMPKETEALFTPDGWLRTGDQGSLDGQGNLRITGRLKELIITAGGKNVAPVELEQYIQSIDGVGQAVVVGDRKPFLAALIALDPENLSALAEAAGEPPTATMSSLAQSEAVLRYLEREVEARCNAKVARYQSIKKLVLLGTEFTVEGGELTASMKLRRSQIASKYADQIEAIYRDAKPPPAQPRA